MIVPNCIYNVETSSMTQIISNAIIDFYNGGKQRYELPLRVPETVILNKRNNL